MNSKEASSLESVSSCGTNNSAYFCLEEDSTAMKYSVSVDIEGPNTLNQSNDESMLPGMKVEHDHDTLRNAFPSKQCQNQNYYNMPYNANSIFRPHSNRIVNTKSNKIAHANPVLGSESDGTSASNHKSDGDATMKSSCSINRTSKMIHDGPNSMKFCDNDILSTPTKDKLRPVKLFRMTSQGNSDLNHMVSSSSNYDTQKVSKYDSFSLNNHSIDGTSYTNVKDTDSIEIPSHNSERPENEVKSTYLGNIRNNMKVQKERMIKQCNIFQTYIYSYSSSLSSCCTTNIVSSVIPLDRACSERNVVEKELNVSEYIGIDELRGFEQWTKDIGVEVAEIYTLLKHHYFEYPIACFDQFDVFKNKDNPVRSQLQRVESSSMEDNLSSQNFVNEVDTYAQELGISRSEFLARVASIIFHQKSNKDLHHDQTKNDDINNTLMKIRASHVPCKFSTNTRIMNSNEPLHPRKNIKMIKDDSTREWENNGLKQSYRSSRELGFTSYKDPNNSKAIKANTRIGMGKVQIGSNKKNKTTNNIVRKGRFRLIT